jgi:homoserine kinase
VLRVDAVYNIARVAQLVVALGSGDRHDLASAFDDRLHQDQRLKRVPMTARALETMKQSGAAACWLSGSGPTAAALVFVENLVSVEQSLAEDGLSQAGRSMRLTIDLAGLQAAR